MESDPFSKLPLDVQTSLKRYLHTHEVVLSFLQEVWVARIDVSWVILTNERVVIATRKLFNVSFADYSLKSLDIDISLGFPFDTVDLESFSKKYTGHFYWFNRERTLKFIEDIERRMEEGESNNQPLLEEKKSSQLDVLKELAELQKQGIITKEEFEKKKKQILKDI